MSTEGLRVAGIILITVSTIQFGGPRRTATQLLRLGLVLPPILMPLGFFLSVASPRSERPNRLIHLVSAGALCLAATTVTLGVGLLLG